MPLANNKKKTAAIVLVIIIVGLFIYSRFVPQGGWGQMPGAPPVSVAEVIERDIQPWSEFSGRLVAIDQADIRPRVSGPIESIHFKDGAMVAKGDLLFVIDPKPYQAALVAAQARAALAESVLARAKALMADKAIAQRDFDQRKNDAAVAEADLTTAKLNLGYTQVKAPINGRVSRAEVTVGNLVEAGPNAPLLTTIVSMSPIYADFEIDEGAYLRSVRADDTGNTGDIPVTITLSNNGEPISGHIESFDNRLNPTSGTIRARAIFDNENGALVPGLFARVRLGSANMVKALLITDRAVGTDQDRKYVIVVGEGNKTARREVKLGGLSDGLRIVESGLQAGDKIVVSGMQRIMMPGQPVTPQTVAMDAPPAPEGASAPPADAGKAPEQKPEEKKPEEPKAAAPEAAPADANPAPAAPEDAPSDALPSPDAPAAPALDAPVDVPAAPETPATPPADKPAEGHE